jgi:hypothetical protein
MSKESVPLEIDLRGSTLKLSVTIEGLLMNIVYASNKKLYTDKKLSEFFKLKGCMFSQKIDKVEKVLHLFHKDLLINNAKLFEDLRTFKNLRNRIAHCGFYWGNSLHNFQIWDVVEGEERFEYYHPFEYSVIEVRVILVQAIDDIVHPLTDLFREVERRLQVDSPELYARLRLGKDFHETD